jgi:hypothetical protein
MSSAPISLYLDLERGQKADLEVVARASIAFAEAIRAVAFFFDPNLELKIELASGTEGSLSLNSILKSVKTGDGKELTLAAIGGVVLFWFGNHLLDWGFEKVMDLITGKEDNVKVEMNLSPEDIMALQGLVDKAIEGKVGQHQVQEIYRNLEGDPAIAGVGVTRVPERRPAVIVPRNQFQARAGGVSGSIPQLIATLREPITQETLILVRPVLVPGHRRWRFAGRQGEFGAPILDDEFLQNLMAGNFHIPISAGIEMDVELQTTEQRVGSVWVPVARNVLKVKDVRPAPTQQALPLLAPRKEQDNDD